MALRGLLILARSGLDPRVSSEALAKSAKGEIKWPFRMLVFDFSLRRCLFDLLLDPFEDVRQDASKLLQLDFSANFIFDQGPPQTSGIDFGAFIPYLRPSALREESRRLELTKLLDRGQIRMLDSGRVDHADGVARVFELLAQNALNQMPGPFLMREASEESWQTPFSADKIVDQLRRAIQKAVSIAKSDLLAAVDHYPVHGLFIAMRHASRV